MTGTGRRLVLALLLASAPGAAAGWCSAPIEDIALAPDQSAVHLRAVDPEGRPIAGARLRQRFELSLDGRTTQEVDRECVAGPDGWCRGEPLPPVARLRLELRAEGRATAVRTELLRAGWSLDLGDWELAPESVLRGEVLGPEGPIPGATVRVDGHDAVSCDAQGGFVCRGLGAGEYWLTPDAEGWIGTPAPPVRLDTGEQRELRLRVAPPETLEVEVVDEAGRPIGGASLAVTAAVLAQLAQRGARTPSYPSRAWEARTDHEGRARFEALPRGELLLSASGPGHRLYRRNLPRGQSSVRVSLLALPCELGQIVHERGGEALEPLHIGLLTASTERGPWQPAIGADLGWDRGDGYFQFRTLGSSWHRVVVETADAVRSLSEPFRRDPSGERVLRCTAHDGPRLQGRVTDEESRPIAGAVVQLVEQPGRLLSAPLPLREMITTADGRFVSAPLAPGRYQLQARAPGRFPAGTSVGVEPNAEPIAIGLRLLPCATLVVRTEGVAGRRQRGMNLDLIRLDGDAEEESPPTSTHPLSPSESRVALEALPPGRYRVEVQAPGFGRVRANAFRIGPDGRRIPVELPEDQPPALILKAEPEELELAPGRVGRVTLRPDLSQLAVLRGGVRIGGEVARGVDVVWSHEQTREQWTSTTDPDGRYEFRGLPPGPGSLGLYLSATARSPWFQPIELTAGQRARFDLEVGLASVHGRLVDRSGEPIPRSSLDLSVLEGEDRPRPLQTVRSDADGRFRFDRVPAGVELRIEASRIGAVRVHVDLNLEDGEERRLADLVHEGRRP